MLVGVMLLAALDYALVRLESGHSRGALGAWLAGVGFAFTHPVLTLGIWAGAGAVAAVGLGVFIALRELTSAGSVALPAAAAIPVSVVLQQLFVLARTWVRVGLLGAEQHTSVPLVVQASATGENPPATPAPKTSDNGTERDTMEEPATQEAR